MRFFLLAALVLLAVPAHAAPPQACVNPCTDVCVTAALAKIAKFNCQPKPTDVCYQTHSACLDSGRGCEWKQTPGLQSCLQPGAQQQPVPPASKLECAVGGCSGQLCVNKAEAASVVSTCEWRESYACFQKLGHCEVVQGPDGQPACGWRPTPTLQLCLQETGGFAPDGGAVMRNIQ